MKLLIITHATHQYQEGQWYAYAPYIAEMRLWEKHVDEVTIVAPVVKRFNNALVTAYQHKKLSVRAVPAISLTSLSQIVHTLIHLPAILYRIFSEMRKADHIHLRCPGNMGLLGCIVQLFFPKKKKSAKYAGNWDPHAKQPWSYRLQKAILKNKSLTKNMQVMVYGDWQETSQNIVPFFTATYPDTKKNNTLPVFTAPYQALFVGTLSKGKRPLYAVQLLEKLKSMGIPIHLTLYGEGPEREVLIRYIDTHKLQDTVVLRGNCAAEEVERAYQKAAFLILPSVSEGWPKAVAEAMFWGVLPLATPVSCVPQMVDYGNRGLLLTLCLEKDAAQVIDLLQQLPKMKSMAAAAQQWSQQFTLEQLEAKIVTLLYPDTL